MPSLAMLTHHVQNNREGIAAPPGQETGSCHVTRGVKTRQYRYASQQFNQPGACWRPAATLLFSLDYVLPEEFFLMPSQANNPNLSTMSFEERLQLGARNAVRCMGVTDRDRVFILTDSEREGIARRVVAEALACHA